jgi:hypothetical protein
MYTLVRRFIKTGILFLFAGLLLGLWLLVRRERYGMRPHPYLVSAHTHALTMGFLMFMVLGVALWLFPRPAKDDRRYSPAMIAACYWILTTSTAARFMAEVGEAWYTNRLLSWIVVVSGLGQVGGLVLYFYTMWTRIRGVGSHVRESAGERF